jgi:hypothetical protein
VSKRNNQFPSTDKQIITESPKTKILGFGHWDFLIGICLEVGIWKLRFQRYALCSLRCAALDE